MRPVHRYFLITVAVTWSCVLAAGLISGPGGNAQAAIAVQRWPLLILGAFAPSLVALAMTYRDEGRAGTRALLARLLEWRVGARWFAFALLYMAAIKLGVALVLRLATGSWPPFGHYAWPSFLVTALVATIFGGPLGEELGWRGYALPRLAEHFGYGRASIIVGVVWALWHLPIFFIPGLDQSGQSLFTYIPQVMALSVAMTWLYVHTRGSLLLAVLMHSAINQSKDIVTSIVHGAVNPLLPSRSPIAWVTITLLWIAAALMLARLSREAGVAREAEPLTPAFES